MDLHSFAPSEIHHSRSLLQVHVRPWKNQVRTTKSPLRMSPLPFPGSPFQHQHWRFQRSRIPRIPRIPVPASPAPGNLEICWRNSWAMHRMGWLLRIGCGLRLRKIRVAGHIFQQVGPWTWTENMVKICKDSLRPPYPNQFAKDCWKLNCMPIDSLCLSWSGWVGPTSGCSSANPKPSKNTNLGHGFFDLTG